jgi:multiple sugar transport system ATP-binding protein
VEAEGARLALPKEIAGADGELVFGIRPEHLDVVDAEDGIPAKVEVIEPTGAVTYVFTHIGTTPVCAAINDRRLPQPGDRIGLAPQRDRIHLFDSATGMRIN